MPLPSPLLEEFSRRLEEPLAWAMRCIREVVASSGQADDRWQAVWAAAGPGQQRAMADLIRLLRADRDVAQRWLEPPPDAALIERWWAVARGASTQLRPEVEQEPALHSALGRLRERYLEASSTANPEAALKALLPELAALRGQSRHPGTEREVLEFQAELHYELGRRLAQAKHPEEAIREFGESLRLATDHELPALADAARLALAGHYRRGAADIDEALRQILPLWRQGGSGPPTLGRARLAVQLAHIYTQVRDHYECRRYIRQAEACLQAVGLDYPIDRSFPTALSAWLAALQPSARLPNDLRRDLYGALTLHIEIAKLYTDLLPEGPARGPWYERVDSLTTVTQELQEADQRRYREDARLMEGLYAEGNASPRSPALDFPTPAAATLSARIDGYRRRLDADGGDEDLVKALRADLEQAGQLALSHLRLAFHWLLGEALAGMERNDEAMTEFRKAYALSMADGDLDSALYALNWELICYAAEQHQERLDLCCRAIGLIEKARRDISTPYQQSAFLADKQSFYQLGMIAAFKLGQYEEMLRIGELIKSRNLQLPNAADRRDAPRRAALKNKLEAIAIRLQSTTEVESVDLRRERQLLWDQWAVDQAALSTAAERPEWSLPALQATLKAGEAILSYHLLDASVLLVGAIDRERVVFVRQLAKAEGWLARLAPLPAPGFAAAFRARVAAGQQRGIRLPTAGKDEEWDGRPLADFLLPAALHPLLADKDRLYVAPHRQLHEVPFQMLPFREGFLIEQFAISYLPNLSCRLFPTPAASPGGLLLVGADQYAPAGRRRLPNLPGAAGEVRELESAYAHKGTPLRALLNEGATRHRLQALDETGELAGFRVLHLALHGEDLPGDAPLDARLFLRDAPIDGFDISLWRLRADLVVLSCCFAGSRPVAGRGLQYLPGDDLFGLQAAFFAAGARRVLGALWPVDDEAGKRLMLLFHRRLADQEPARALQSATLAYLREAPEERQHPAYWAPFFLTELYKL